MWRAGGGAAGTTGGRGRAAASPEGAVGVSAGCAVVGLVLLGGAVRAAFHGWAWTVTLVRADRVSAEPARWGVQVSWTGDTRGVVLLLGPPRLAALALR